MIRELTADEIASVEFTHLLWLAVEVDNDELDRIKRDELGPLTIIGVVDNEIVVAFAAFEGVGDPVVVEYIAVDERAQRSGFGRALVGAIHEGTRGRSVYAETDDDAVDFYRRVGFTITAKTVTDPRWPERQRYDCLLQD
jgi:ribosomal protein S18 acetylase RimI-like enzyme